MTSIELAEYRDGRLAAIETLGDPDERLDALQALVKEMESMKGPGVIVSYAPVHRVAVQAYKERYAARQFSDFS